MEIENVPQDDSATYANMKKSIYASNTDGKIQSISSTGWDVEEVVTQQAIDDINEHIKEAYALVKSGKKSPLYFYMYEVRMDLAVLSQSTGFFEWTIKRDFKPIVFESIGLKRLLVYCDALGKSIDELTRLPEVGYE